jgi:2-oxoglutarate ferredoxin oxidoreductase subunit delta
MNAIPQVTPAIDIQVYFPYRSLFEKRNGCMKYWRKPLDLESIRASGGKVIIIEDRCKGCGFCVEYCPRDVLRMSSAFNAKGYHTPTVLSESKCVNCHFCEDLCPEFAIYSIEAVTETT